MNGKIITKKEANQIKNLRQKGHSISEICTVLGRGKSTIQRYTKEVAVLPEFADILKRKQGGSIVRAEKLWKESEYNAKKLLKKISKKEKLLILAAIYWGEGTKKDLNIINSDPDLIRVFISCIKEIGVNKDDLRVSIRIYDSININESKKYWAKVCRINIKSIVNVNVLKGKKEGKLPYGMCRVRVTNGTKSFKLIISMIKFIKKELT
ncbi:MAG: hypothetical protein COX29_04190 [Candidatus Moranbacteria bacterium CG23_combo_of_CG06-09_8_20_14_all_35_22]|nr:MAG: hypothetical protein COX29_04190 [Candidatus Moranbacteria bacterium CG23_combo_of_CG06-09_8_20_14_all_35_22]